MRRILKLAALGAAILLATPAAQAADPVRIGFGMALTGGLAGNGKAALLALQIWAEDVNAAGGLLGRKVELVYYDDQSMPAQVPGIYSKLLDVDKVDLVVFSYATNQIAPAMPIVMQRNLVFMALFGTGVNDNFNYDKYFQILPNGRETRLAPSLGFLETAMSMQPKPQTIALAAADAEYAQTVVAGARETVKRLGLRVVYDGDANAAYFFLPYGPRFTNLTAEEQKAAQTYSHSINPESLLRFDAQGGLLSVVIPTDAVKSLDDFLFFFERQE